MLNKEKRPWGYYEVLLDDSNCKVKRIVVNIDGILSLQYHHKRSERWTIVEGVATVTLDDKQFDARPGTVVAIEKEVVHRVQNNGDKPLVFVEVQLGEYFGEDDIVRLEDNYGRQIDKAD